MALSIITRRWLAGFAAIVFVAPLSTAHAATDIFANIGGVLFDQYTTGTNGVVGCGSFGSQRYNRDCYQTLFSTWHAQNVAGIRLFFNMCGAGNQALSSCTDSNAQVNSAWLTNFGLFLADMKNAGITKLVITPGVYGGNGDGAQLRDVYDACTQTIVSLRFYPFAPFGVLYDSAHPNFPHGQGINQAYNCSPSNPLGIGREPFYRVIDAVVGLIKSSGVFLYELDMQQELNLADFTVQARLIYDNTTNDNILARLMGIMNTRGFPMTNVTYSVVHNAPKSTSQQTREANCSSVFGQPARHFPLSQVLSALDAGFIGTPAGVNGDIGFGDTGLPCGGSTSGMLHFPALYVGGPSVFTFDVHDYPCTQDNCSSISMTDLQTQARLDYSALKDLLNLYGPANPNNGYTYAGLDYFKFLARVFIGETTSNTISSAGYTCDGDNSPPSGAAAYNYAGFAASTLAAHWYSVLSPWHNLLGICNTTGYPPTVNPPYISR
jgi:hypothetical protein